MDVHRKKETGKLSDEFIANLSHSLRSPLTCIKEAVAIVLDGLCGPLNKKQARMLKIAMKQINRLTETMENLLKKDKIG